MTGIRCYEEMAFFLQVNIEEINQQVKIKKKKLSNNKTKK